MQNIHPINGFAIHCDKFDGFGDIHIWIFDKKLDPSHLCSYQLNSI